jgi:hypothetical protein
LHDAGSGHRRCGAAKRRIVGNLIQHDAHARRQRVCGSQREPRQAGGMASGSGKLLAKWRIVAGVKQWVVKYNGVDQ